MKNTATNISYALDHVYSSVVALRTAKTIANFNVEKSILEIVNAPAVFIKAEGMIPEILADGSYHYLGYKFTISVIDQFDNHGGSYEKCLEFVAAQNELILANLELTCSVSASAVKPGYYQRKKSVRIDTEIIYE